MFEFGERKMEWKGERRKLEVELMKGKGDYVLMWILNEKGEKEKKVLCKVVEKWWWEK